MSSKKGRVLFIIHDLYQDFNQFMLGPAYLAAMLIKNGHKAEIYAQDIYHYTNEELAAYLDANDFDLICVGFLAARFKETVEPLCHVINKHKKKAWLVLGGFGPSPVPEYMIKTTGAEIVAIGEAEETIIDIIESKLNSKPSLDSIKGIAFKDNSSVRVNPRRKPIMQLDTIPFPAWEIYPMEDYSRNMRVFNQPSTEKSLVILSSRGCVNACNFCYRMEKGLRSRSMENVIEELKILVNDYGIKYFFTLDEMFVMNKKKLFEFEKLLLKNNLEIKYACDARVDVLDKELARCLKRTGCIFLNFGIESADDEVLRLMGKNTTVEQNIRAVEIMLDEGGINIGLNMLWGNLGDNEETLKKDIAFIKKYNTYISKYVRTIKPPTPYPGCELYYKAIEMGLLKGPEDFFDKFKNSDLYLVNFTDIPTDRFYELLFETNKYLITDHYTHTGEDMKECENLIQAFHDLYTGKTTKFRGARTFSTKDKVCKE